MKLMKRLDSQIICFYFKNEFNKKLTRYQKKTLVILKKIQSEDYDKFLKEKFDYIIEKLKRRVSKEYHNEIEIFMRHKADEFVFHKKKDHQINITSRFESSFVRNYKSMFEKELKTVKHYLNEHLAKEYIRLSSSTTAVFVLLIKKSEEELRFCVDYRVLNEIIVKNRYSISLLNEILIRLSRIKKFIKIDVIHAFNKMRIRKEDEWLIAFNTRYEQFEYLVMSFELCNASTIF